MLERTIIYVDTSYLLASFYNTWATGARAQLEIDLPEVVNVLECRAVNQLNQPVHRQNWYDGIPDSGPHRYQRALRSCPGVQLRAGQLIEWGDRRTQKAVDTRLVADMVLSSANREVTDIILVSGDADMLPGVEESVARGVRVHIYGFGWDSMSSNLRYACDTTTILDPREHFAECMRLEVLEGPLKAGGTAETTETAESAEPAEPAEPADTAETAEAAGPGEVTEPAGSDRAVTTTGETANTVTDQTTAPCQNDGTPESTGANGHSVRQHKPIGDAEPVEDLSGTSAVPDVRRRSGAATAQASAAPADTARASDAAAESATPNDAAPSAAPSATSSAAPSAAATPASHAPSPADLANGGRASTPTSADAGAPATDSADGASGDDSAEEAAAPTPGASRPTPGSARPTPAMMASRRRLRNRYVPLPTEIWQSGGQQSPFDIGEQYAIWWYHNAIDDDQRDEAHTYTGGRLPPEINRPLLQFACETLHEYTLTEYQRVNLRDGFHSGIRGILMKK
ncbi:MAG TPA: NYN domain-containing protein [Candidatus Corynebacterium faecigallinarum]|uniref:NYN domain-containing protein n=1 Tax=Candidatus Corynebacterium faecigallinarum TaxID=2838528 RepID=A0A9D2QE69_9CORY|nr:NYN domain-containing protein [Candidatus Corynebacterium faecigallinarum]